MLTERLALYTTVYPGVEKYLSAWYDSVKAQTDRDFDTWIGVDDLETRQVITAMGAEPPATWVLAKEGDSPAQIRQRAIEQMVRQYPAVVFADSDDILEPTRVEAARAALQESDVSGCAMRIVDENGRDLGLTFRPPNGVEPSMILTRYNVFGLSNTAYRSELLGRCLLFPVNCVLVDWFLATCAWTLGASFHFDLTCRMAYRQHANNTARVMPPFAPHYVVEAAEQVLRHYEIVLTHILGLKAQHQAELKAAQSRARAFYDAISKSSETLSQYINALNLLSEKHIWWDIVAHPKLEEIWRN
jgi:hypothetical protein